MEDFRNVLPSLDRTEMVMCGVTIVVAVGGEGPLLSLFHGYRQHVACSWLETVKRPVADGYMRSFNRIEIWAHGHDRRQKHGSAPSHFEAARPTAKNAVNSARWPS